jgi:hypothetical protein
VLGWIAVLGGVLQLKGDLQVHPVVLDVFHFDADVHVLDGPALDVPERLGGPGWGATLSGDRGPSSSACTCQVHERPVKVEVQLQRKLPFATHLEAGAVAPVGAAPVLRSRGVGEHLPRRYRLGVLVPFGVHGGVARYRLSRDFDPARGRGLVLHRPQLGCEARLLLLDLREAFAQLVGGAAFFVRYAPREASLAKRSPGSNSEKGGDAWRLSDALKTWQLYALWAVFVLNTTAGLAILSEARVMAASIGGASAALAAVFIMIISASDAMGRLLWPALSDRIGGRAVFLAMMFCLQPHRSR